MGSLDALPMVDSANQTAKLRCQLLQERWAWAFCLVALLVPPRAAWGQGPSGEPPPHAPGPARLAPPRLDRNAVADHIERVRATIGELRSPDRDGQTLLDESGQYLDRANEGLRRKDSFLADRFVAASDAFVQAAEHSQGIEDGPRRSHPIPRPQDIAEHLQHVYFHLQQADYFAGTSSDGRAKRLPELARRFYEWALRAYDSSDWLEAENLAKAVDDTIRGLENLAQSATPLPPRPR
jgi:hypothetical protein